MKIGIDISQSVYHGTGIAVYTRNLVKALLEVDRQNHYVLFGSTLRRQTDLFEFIKSLPHTTPYTSKIFSLPPTALNIIWNKIHAVGIESFVGSIDIFHTSDWTEPPAKAKKVTTIHDLVVYKYPEFLNKRIIDVQRKKLEWVKKESIAIIADSQNTKDDIIKYLGVSANKIHVVYLGIEKKYFPQKIDVVRKIRKKFKIHGEYILCVGTREPRKNLKSVVEAFGKLRKDLTLVIVGNPGWSKDIKVQQNVRILDFIEEIDLPGLYTGAACFVYPSLYEGFGLPVLEAMACGCLVVTSDRGSLAEIAKGVSVMVNPESNKEITEGIESILSLSSSKRKIVIDRGLKHAQKFTWQNTAQETLKVYESLI